MNLSKLNLGLALLGAGIASASATVVPFCEITANTPDNVSSQLGVDVTAGANVSPGTAPTILFTFHNVGAIASSITDIYFDDGTPVNLSAPLVPIDGPGTNFSTPASPGNLPGAAAVGFVTTTSFSADSDAPVTANGVNATLGDTESVGIQFNLTGGRTVAQVIDALLTGSLRIGLHVQGIGAANASESYVSCPEPAKYALLGTALLGIVGGHYRLRRKGNGLTV